LAGKLGTGKTADARWVVVSAAARGGTLGTSKAAGCVVLSACTLGTGETSDLARWAVGDDQPAYGFPAPGEPGDFAGDQDGFS
ncbi:MAG: hypothetical protein ACK559_20325, partial [bacterium]